MYIPDSWRLVEITGTDPHYRVFASWSGGYLNGDSWRLNSGILSVEEDSEYYYFYGFSKSVYKCHKESYGISNVYSIGVLADLVSNSGGNMHIVEDCPDVMNLNWKIGRNK